jgi:hypothetical protein
MEGSFCLNTLSTDAASQLDVLRAILDDSLPGHVELDLLLAFLLQYEKMESIHPSFFVEALSDWVPRLLVADPIRHALAGYHHQLSLVGAMSE